MPLQDAAAPARSMDDRLGCSTISFRALPLPDALARIAGLGFGEIDLGALPGTCDHVPLPCRRSWSTCSPGRSATAAWPSG